MAAASSPKRCWNSIIERGKSVIGAAESSCVFVICSNSEWFLLLGLDPTSAVRLKLGEDAAAELGAIPDTEALRMADEAIVHRYSIACGTASSEFIANIERSASNMCKNFKANLANASLEDFITSTSINFTNASFVQLLAFHIGY